MSWGNISNYYGGNSKIINLLNVLVMMASTLQLEFAQAMSDFKTMFPDMERDVIEAVLRANQGAVDATIDQLLAMSTDNQVHKVLGKCTYFLEFMNFEYFKSICISE